MILEALDYNSKYSETVAPSTSKPSSSRAQAGPSRGVTANSNRRKAAITIEESDADDVQQPVTKKSKTARGRKQTEQEEEVDENERAERNEDDQEVDGEEVEEVDPPPPPASRAEDLRSLLSGQRQRQSKSKPPSTAQQQNVEPMDIDSADAPEFVEDVEEESVGKGHMNVAQAINAAAKSARIGARGVKSGRAPQRPSAQKNEDITRLGEQLSQANTHIEDLKRQLDELYKNEWRCNIKLKYEVLIKKAHSHVFDCDVVTLKFRVRKLVEDFRAKLAQKDTLFRPGKTAVFELLTREEADREMQNLQQQLKSYKDAIQERDQRLKEMEEEVKDLQQNKRKLSASKAQQQRQPHGSASRAHTGPMVPMNQDPKYAEVLKFYEDLSNVIVPNIKVLPGRYLHMDEWLLSCCYTHKDVMDKTAIPKSLYFSLRLCHDLKAGVTEPVERQDQLVESVHYIPKELDKESPEFVESLGFLSDTFTFERDQLSLFLRTLHDNISGEGNDDNSRAGQGGEESGSDDNSSC
ncbi:hypothetical protein BDZ97DRAFT_1918430 [Flammula alnicola]|nr:hypothetical protein BDZ97DRAFT_1918430 [Flammula alnicola]